MLSGNDPVVRWRLLAADAREAADQSTDPEAKLIILSIAQAYEHLARRAKERKPKKDKKGSRRNDVGADRPLP